MPRILGAPPGHEKKNFSEQALKPTRDPSRALRMTSATFGEREGRPQPRSNRLATTDRRVGNLLWWRQGLGYTVRLGSVAPVAPDTTRASMKTAGAGGFSMAK